MLNITVCSGVTVPSAVEKSPLSIYLLIHHQNLTRKALSFISFFITAIHYLHSVPDNLTFSVFFFPCCTMPTYIVLYTYILLYIYVYIYIIYIYSIYIYRPIFCLPHYPLATYWCVIVHRV